MGCSVLNILYRLEISLLEILLIYTIKMSTQERFSLTVHTPFLQMVARLPDSSKGWAKGSVLVFESWRSSHEGPDRHFGPNRTLDPPSLKYFVTSHVPILIS